MTTATYRVATEVTVYVIPVADNRLTRAIHEAVMDELATAEMHVTPAGEVIVSEYTLDAVAAELDWDSGARLAECLDAEPHARIVMVNVQV